MRVEGVLYLLAYGVFLTSAQTDLARTRNANGSEVVRATVELISDSGVFGGCDDNNQLLRRIAYVETQDGIRSLPNGGIWRVTANMLNPTRSNRQLTNEHQLILNQFEIIWPRVSFSMLRIPLYSALAAGLFLCTIREPIPIASDIRGQGMYWVQHYRGLTSDSAAVERFVRDIMELEMQESQCEIRGLDLIFLLDNSGSVGADNYELVKQFVADVSESLEIGPQRTQVGVISFSSFVHFDIDLDAHQTKPSLLQAIDALPYVSGGTDTTAGLNALIDEGFTQARGVRRIVEGFPRVTIVVTDGRSNNRQATITAANRVKEANVQVFAVGFGNTDFVELQAIATNSATDVFTLETFDVGELQQLQETLSEAVCRASTPVDISQPLNTSVDSGVQVNVNYICPEEGITFRICAGDGELVMYISQNATTTPSAALHDKELRASDGKCNDTYCDCQNFGNRRKRQEPASTGVTVYCTIRGIEERNTFTLDTTSGDTSTPRASTPVDISQPLNTSVGRETFFQLRIGPLQYCDDWIQHSELVMEMERSIRNRIASVIAERCNCNFSAQSIAIGNFTCTSTLLHWIVYRSTLMGTNPNQMVEILQEWVGTSSARIVINPVILAIDASCPVSIQSLDDVQCDAPDTICLNEETVLTRDNRVVRSARECLRRLLGWPYIQGQGCTPRVGRRL